MALDRQRDVLQIELPYPDDEQFVPIAKLLVTAAATVLQTTTKIDENSFKARQVQGLNALLKAIRAGVPPVFDLVPE